MSDKNTHVTGSASSASRCSGSGKNSSPSKNAVPPEGIRCTYTDLAGRQCRNLALRPTGKDASRLKTGLCLAHATEMRMLLDAEAVAGELISGAPKLDTPIGINYVLAKLFELTINDRIPTRKAALLTYQASLLLHSVSGVKREIQTTFEDEVWNNMIIDAVNTIDGTTDSDSSDEEKSDAAPTSDSNPVAEAAP
ncbi:MAG: hypothetical protein WAM91_17260 [Candidatus Acidiferrales bacterium]